MTDPVEKLLERDEHRETMLRTLGSKLTTMWEVSDEYKDAWRAATGVGWARADLIKAGFVDPSKLPRRTSTRRSVNED